MNEFESLTPQREELVDRLIDGGLREVVGGERPPDLSAAILAKAGQLEQVESSTDPVTTSGDTIMDENHSKQARARFGWWTLAVAATLLVACGWFVVSVRNDQKQAAALRAESQSTDRVAKPEPLEERQVAFDTRSDEAAANQGEALAEPNSKAEAKDIMHYYADDARPVASADGSKLRMFATPRIIIAEEESERLAVEPAEDADGQQATVLGGLVNDAYGVNVNSAIVPVAPKEPAEMPALSTTTGATVVGDLVAVAPASARAQDRFSESDDVGAPARGGRHASIVADQLSQLSLSAEGAPSTIASNSTTELDQPFRQSTFGLETPQKDLAKQVADTRAKLVRLSSSAESKNSTEWRTLESGLHALEQQLDVAEQGQGPDLGGDKYARIEENPFKAISAATTDNRLSTFSIDVDTASYANVRQFLTQSGTLPPPDAVRIEELVNYFQYDYSGPTDETPFAANVETAGCPWNPDHRLVRIGIKGRELANWKRPKSNLVFLIDVSGSMDEPNKLPLLIEGMKLLTRELGENDRVAIAVYASSEGLALESTPGTEQQKILEALGRLSAGGSTAGGAGIQLAYDLAAKNFVEGGVNRVILCTDGDFNVGVTSPAELERMAETKAKDTGVFLTVLGFGRGNLNDAMMEQIADKGNGNYHYVDALSEARKVLVEEMAGTLVTIAKDVKIQVEFNPAQVGGYRLIGYENRVMAAEDFNDDKKDAGEIGAGHTVTALYEIVPPGKKVDAANVDELKYEKSSEPRADGDGESGETASTVDDAAEEMSNELLTLKIRYKEPDGEKSTKLEFPITDNGQKFAEASEDFKFASAVASFGMLLRHSEHSGNATLSAVVEIAQASLGRDEQGRRKEFVELVNRAKELSGE